MDTLNSLKLVLPELILSFSGLALLLVSAWGQASVTRLISVIGVGVLVASGVAACSHQGEAFDGIYVADSFSAFAKILVYIAGIGALIIAPRYLAKNGALRSEYPLLILFACVGMGMMVSARDMLTLYIGLELNSLAAYVLAAFIRDDQKSSEAGLKYFVLGALASGILLFGMSLVYGFTGATDFTSIGEALTGDLGKGALFGLVFVLAGLAFKISAVPFHMWTPDVYEGAPTPVTAFFATAPKVAATALTIRVVLEMFGNQMAAWQQIIIFVALASIIVGALGAIGQSNLKRILAFSSINNIGFILIGLAAGTPEGVSGMLVYLAIYVAMTLGSFACIMMLTGRNGAQAETLRDIAGLSKVRPGVALMLAMFMWSLAGIPPLFGFWGKLVVFNAAVGAGLLWLAVIGIAASVIGAFYYLRIVKAMYFDDPDYAPAVTKVSELDWVAAIAAVFISPLGYFAIPWLGALADSAAGSLF
jgi:NADH-quinone oxidoreductase subunit N